MNMENRFFFTIEFEGDVTEKEIGEKEKEYIKKYDSYRNGYNQNEGEVILEPLMAELI